MAQHTNRYIREFRRKFRRAAEIISVKDIILEENIHKQQETEALKDRGTELTVVVSKCGGKYALVTGWGDYHRVLARKSPTIKGIVLKEGINRRKFIKTIMNNASNLENCDDMLANGLMTEALVDVSSIIIPSKYLTTSVGKKKLEAAKQYIRENGNIDKPVSIDENGCLTDGYSRYVAAKECGLEKITVKVFKN